MPPHKLRLVIILRNQERVAYAVDPAVAGDVFAAIQKQLGETWLRVDATTPGPGVFRMDDVVAIYVWAVPLTEAEFLAQPRTEADAFWSRAFAWMRTHR